MLHALGDRKHVPTKQANKNQNKKKNATWFTNATPSQHCSLTRGEHDTYASDPGRFIPLPRRSPTPVPVPVVCGVGDRLNGVPYLTTRVRVNHGTETTHRHQTNPHKHTHFAHTPHSPFLHMLSLLLRRCDTLLELGRVKRHHGQHWVVQLDFRDAGRLSIAPSQWWSVHQERLYHRDKFLVSDTHTRTHARARARTHTHTRAVSAL